MLCGRTHALDCRAHHRLARSVSPARQGLGEPQSQRSRLPPPRIHPPHAQKALQSLMKSSDGLSVTLVAEYRVNLLPSGITHAAPSPSSKLPDPSSSICTSLTTCSFCGSILY